MATLGQLGVQGMLAVNSWIGVINSNLQGSSRIGYKPTRPTFSDGTVNRINNEIQLPSPTLNVQATSLEWAQGSIVNSTARTHFALQGQGFFVATDGLKYYLTRDGEFHWDGQGYLTTSNGLRVLSSGQDYIRIGRGDESDIFDADGRSHELARYGNKSLMIIDVANRDGLRFSRFGATVFELDGDLPLRVQNDFSASTDGLTFLYRDPKQRSYVDAPQNIDFTPFGPGIDSDFGIDLGGNGPFQFRDFNPLGAGINFNPATNTIQHVIQAIDSYRIANGISAASLSASYDPGSDRFSLTNIPEPKVADPGFVAGNFAIDFGDNGLFTYRGFDPNRTTIQNIVDEINRYALVNNRNIVASYNALTDTFNLTNTVAGPGNNEIVFDGSNGPAMADFMNMPVVTASNGGGAQVLPSTGPIDNPLPIYDITASDVTNTPLGQLIRPPSRIVFQGPNGNPLATIFRLVNATPEIAFNTTTGATGQTLRSSRDIDNSDVLTSSLLSNHDLDILAADVAGKTFATLMNTTDAGAGSVPAFDFAGPPPLYSHDENTGRLISDGSANNGHGLIAIGQAQRTSDFDLVLDFNTTTARLELHFGYDKEEQIDSGGFSLYYDPGTGALTLTQRSIDPNIPPLVLVSRPPGTLPLATGLAGMPHRLSARLTAGGDLSLSVDGSSPPQSFSLAGFSQQRSGYLSLGHQGGVLQIDNLYADFRGKTNIGAHGEVVSVSNTPHAAVDVRGPEQGRERTRIVQSALESSTASLTEYLPMLSLAQKVFSALSKIITTSNALTDDMNSLIR